MTATTTLDIAPSRHPLAAHEITSAALELGANLRSARAAGENLAAGRVQFIAMSGKMGAGKDTFARPILTMLGHQRSAQGYFAYALKAEMTEIFETIREWSKSVPGPLLASLPDAARTSLARAIAETHNIPMGQAREYFAGVLADDVLRDRTLLGTTRTQIVRAAQQNLGTDVRRAQDDQYWVKRTMPTAIDHLAAGASVYFTDTRFSNELSAVRALGGLAIRLDVSPETQLARLRARDGEHLEVTEAQRMHASEVELDDYAFFDVRVSNEGTVAATTALLRAGLELSGLATV